MLRNGRERTPKEVVIIMLRFLILRDSWRRQPDVGPSVPLTESQRREEVGQAESPDPVPPTPTPMLQMRHPRARSDKPRDTHRAPNPMSPGPGLVTCGPGLLLPHSAASQPGQPQPHR